MPYGLLNLHAALSIPSSSTRMQDLEPSSICVLWHTDVNQGLDHVLQPSTKAQGQELAGSNSGRGFFQTLVYRKDGRLSAVVLINLFLGRGDVVQNTSG